MAVYHGAWDLALLGALAPEIVSAWPFLWFRSAVLGAFLLLAGIGAALAAQRGAGWRAHARRAAILAACAALISAGSSILAPQVAVHFGVLHCLALLALLGPLLEASLRLPSWSLLALGLAAWASAGSGPPAFDAPWLAWLGLGPSRPSSLDFVPLAPWLAPFCAGLVLGRRWARLPPAWLGAWPSGAWARPLLWAGRHALAVYLLHQPLLLGALAAAVALAAALA